MPITMGKYFMVPPSKRNLLSLLDSYLLIRPLESTIFTSAKKRSLNKVSKRQPKSVPISHLNTLIQHFRRHVGMGSVHRRHPLIERHSSVAFPALEFLPSFCQHLRHTPWRIPPVPAFFRSSQTGLPKISEGLFCRAHNVKRH